jgi:hypothetical protein
MMYQATKPANQVRLQTVEVIIASPAGAAAALFRDDHAVPGNFPDLNGN